jgi:hypothetical protein
LVFHSLLSYMSGSLFIFLRSIDIFSLPQAEHTNKCHLLSLFVSKSKFFVHSLSIKRCL